MILASSNPHKLGEFRELLPGVELELLPSDFVSPPETGDTFAENALIKAHAAFRVTGGPVIADDSGIEVEALAGRPGVRSARYAGEDATDEENLARVLRETAAADGGDRARFVCVIALIEESGRERLFKGVCEGRLIGDPRGERGFGYDPAFVPDGTGPEDQRTMAELRPEEKNAVSHRGQAAGALLAGLEA
ncbi:MAG: RdgB/HAM1 family non-canonical purine NTP pyrophosphatase [Solirubrobacterales bacterium]|nr:RdgB/HAM1 family non-canonical purine NTP pyrophosphatase [Solirubrobacterales bacterium]